MFSRDPNQLRVFHWQGGRYQVVTLPEGTLWLPDLQLGIGLWYGAYQGLERHWLRWYDAQSQWIPTPLEQLERERQRAERLSAQLRALGIEPQ